ncbi:hypothetical protein WME76_11410 [Sorangium sp. So ce119]|uniref:hypothetical protein n=1 Tax=Sorangium sp. So ce119 TaxID=3133279 RepID=UPI003F644E7F
MPSRKKSTKNTPSPVTPAGAEPTLGGGRAPEADFDDTIAKNRALPILDPASLPRPPAGFRPTDPDTRNRRLRKVSSELRAEVLAALREAAGLDLAADLGKYAPDPQRAPALVERLERVGRLSAAVQALALYAREMEQIALSDALVFLEAENKQLANALEHAPELAERYAALRALFETRAASIVEGRARAARGAVAVARPPVAQPTAAQPTAAQPTAAQPPAARPTAAPSPGAQPPQASPQTA